AESVPRTEVDPGQHTAAVTFTLVPGTQTAFGRISIHGEQQVEERAIRHQLTIHEGQRFSDKALTASTDAIYNLGMFQAVTPRALNPEAADEPLDVEFEVIERKPRSLQFGLGYSTTEGFRTETLSGALGLNFSRNEFRHVDRAALVGFDPSIAKNNTLLVQFAEVQWNTSDSRLNPSRGLVLRGRIDHANTALVSDFSFVKLVLEGRHYLPLGQLLGRPFLLATRLKVGGIEPYGTTNEVPFNVRFFAGGAGSVRGFTLNRLGPLNKDGDPIGGMSLIEGSAELRFPLFGELGAVLFVDTGNVFRSPFTYRLDALRYAVGPGIRYNTPVGPFRLDVGIIVDRRPGEQFGRVEFSIGQAF